MLKQKLYNHPWSLIQHLHNLHWLNLEKSIYYCTYWLRLYCFKNGQYSYSHIKANSWDSPFWDLHPQVRTAKTCLALQHHPSTINSIPHFTCHWELCFHQFIFIHLPQTDAGALETSSNALAFVSLPKTSSSMLYDLFLSATPRAPTLTRNTPHTSLSFCLFSFSHSLYHHTASVSMAHNGLKHGAVISLTDVVWYVHFWDSSAS